MVNYGGERPCVQRTGGGTARPHGCSSGWPRAGTRLTLWLQESTIRGELRVHRSASEGRCARAPAAPARRGVGVPARLDDRYGSETRSTRKGGRPILPYCALIPINRGVNSYPRGSKLRMRSTVPFFDARVRARRRRSQRGTAHGSEHRLLNAPEPCHVPHFFMPRSTLSDDWDVTVTRRRSTIAGTYPATATTTSLSGRASARSRIGALGCFRWSGAAVR